MTIERLRMHYGFSRMPFSRSIAPGMLFPRHAHKEATARIAWLVAEGAIGVVTGEVGAGKTVAARAAAAALDPSRHTVVYLSNPAVGARGLYAFIVSALGGIRASIARHSSPRPPSCSPPRRRSGPSGWWSWSTRGTSSRPINWNSSAS